MFVRQVIEGPIFLAIQQLRGNSNVTVTHAYPPGSQYNFEALIEKKLKRTYLLYETDIKEILTAEIDSLKRNGFRMKRRIKILGELRKLKEKTHFWTSRTREPL